MPIYHEQWKQDDYMTRRDQYLRDLPQNHLGKINAVKFQFTDYKIYNKIACLPYERMVIQCYNNYGIKGSMSNFECADVMQAFRSCLNVNQYFATLKKTQPQGFITNDYSRDKPAFSEIKI